MNFKTKAIGTLAALVMTMSLSAGALAQQSDSEQVDVVLQDQVCNLDISIASGSFGSWSWNGSAWVNTVSGNTISFDGQLYTPPQKTCKISIAFDGLYLDGIVTGPADISTDNFSARALDGVGSRDPAGWSQDNVSGTDYDFEYQLQGIPSGTAAGHYTGWIESTVVNTA